MFSKKVEGLIAINLAAVIFGTAALYGKLDVSPVWITAMRAAFGALALMIVGGISTKLFRLSASSWLIVASSGFFLAAHWLTFFFSVQLAGVAIATLTFATFPLFTLIVEALAQKRLPKLAELLIGAIIVLAVALLLNPDTGQGNLVGIITGLAAAVTYALYWRVTQLLKQPLSSASLSFGHNAVVFLLLIPALFFTVPTPAGAATWLALASLGVVNTAIMLLLYLYAIKRISASTCSGFVALEPVYAIAFAAWLFDEPITAWIIMSVILILGASFALLKMEK